MGVSMTKFRNYLQNIWSFGHEEHIMEVPFSTIDWLNRPSVIEEIASDNEEINNDQEPQVWKDFEETSERFRKNGLVFYGKSSTTANERLSLPVTEFCVSTFNDLGLDALETKLNRLDIGRAAELTRNTCASPCSLVLALLYLERLRSSNPQYLNSISSTDLFLVSLLVASKYLNDDGEEDEVFNDEWATSGGLEKKELNRMELTFCPLSIGKSMFPNKTMSRLRSSWSMRWPSRRWRKDKMDRQRIRNFRCFHILWIWFNCGRSFTSIP